MKLTYRKLNGLVEQMEKLEARLSRYADQLTDDGNTTAAITLHNAALNIDQSIKAINSGQTLRQLQDYIT